MDIIYLLRILKRRKWFILICLMIGVLAGLVFRLMLGKEYVSNAQYATGLYRTQKVSLQLNEIFDANQIDYRLNNVIETFKSPTVLGMMAYDLLEHDLSSSHPFRTLTEKQKADSAFTRVDIQRAKDILREKMSNLDLLSTYDPEQKKVWDLLNLYDYNEGSILRKLTIDRIPKTDFLSIKFGSENPQLSAYVVNEIGVKFREFYNSTMATNTKESLNKLDSLKESKRKEVDDLRKRLQEFREKIGTPNPGDAATAAMSGYQELSSSLTQQQALLNDYRQRLASVIDQLAALNSVSNSNNGSANINNHADEILTLRKQNDEYARQLASKGGNDPDIQSKIDANLNKIIQLRSVTPPSSGAAPGLTQQEKKEKLIQQKLELQSEIASTNENIEMYKGRVDQFRKIAFSGGGQEVVAQAYENDLAAAQKDLDKYNNSLFASQDIDVSPDFNFKQTLIGQPAIKPEPSHGILIVSIAGLSMFFISCLFIIILELLDTSARTPSIFQKETKLHTLAVVNKIDLQKKTLGDYFDFNSTSDRENTSNPFVENMRKLRFEIETSGKKTILVVSPKVGEGKSIILESLAHTFSKSRKKVLLIDANFSNNTLTREFSAKPALESFGLNGSDNAMDKIWSITTLTNITNTDIIGCNEGNYTPSEILPNNNLLDNLDKVVQHYDYVLMEGAALNTHADSKEISSYVEGIIAVFSAKNSLGENDKESIAFLKENHNKFIGAVLNNVDEQNLDL